MFVIGAGTLLACGLRKLRPRKSAADSLTWSQRLNARIGNALVESGAQPLELATESDASDLRGTL